MATYYIEYSDTYRFGREIHVYTEDEDEIIPDENIDVLNVSFISDKEYQLIVVEADGCGTCKIIYKSFHILYNDAELYMNKIYSQEHNSLPFVITGFTGFYKPDGDYPDIPEPIKNMLCIDIPYSRGGSYYRFIAICNNLIILKTQLL